MTDSGAPEPRQGQRPAGWPAIVRRSLSPRALRKAFRYQSVWLRLRARAARHGIRGDRLRRVGAFHRVHYWGGAGADRHPLQNPRSSYFPGLGATPIHDARRFGWTATLEQAYPEIRREALALLDSSALQPHPQRLADSGSWLTSYFYVRGERLEATHKACPVTSSVLERCFPLGPGEQLFFSVLSGGAHIKPHCGPWNTRLTCHLGLLVPDGPTMRVATEIVRWQEGKCLVFDDSFEHEVWNPGDSRRIVLLIQFWHPDLTADEVWALKELMRLEGEGEYEQAVRRGEKMDDGGGSSTRRSPARTLRVS